MTVNKDCCKDCQKRKEGCHSTCKAYLKYRAEKDKLRLQRLQRFEDEEYYYESKRRHL